MPGLPSSISSTSRPPSTTTSSTTLDSLKDPTSIKSSSNCHIEQPTLPFSTPPTSFTTSTKKDFPTHATTSNTLSSSSSSSSCHTIIRTALLSSNKKMNSNVNLQDDTFTLTTSHSDALNKDTILQSLSNSIHSFKLESNDSFPSHSSSTTTTSPSTFPSSSPPCMLLEPSHLHSTLNKDWLLVDIRPPDQFQECRIPTSFNLFVAPLIAKRWQKKPVVPNHVCLSNFIFPESQRKVFEEHLHTSKQVVFIDLDQSSPCHSGSVLGTLMQVFQFHGLTLSLLEGGLNAWSHSSRAAVSSTQPSTTTTTITSSSSASSPTPPVSTSSTQTTTITTTTGTTNSTPSHLSTLLHSSSSPSSTPTTAPSTFTHTTVTTMDSTSAFSPSQGFKRTTSFLLKTKQLNLPKRPPAVLQASLDEPSQILAWLYLGPDLFASNLEDAVVYLKKFNITSILNITFETYPTLPNLFAKYKQIACQDTVDEKIEDILDPATEFIEESRLEGRNIYVHCKAGVSRSATVVLAYLVKYQRMPFEEAHAFLRSKRPVIAPNIGFLSVLKVYAELNQP